MHILILEDDALLAMNLQILVEDLGCTSSVVVASEREAVARAQLFRPSLIIADLHLSDGLGVTAIQKIRASIGHIPVVYVTGDPEQAQRLDPDALVLGKPVTNQQLIAALARLKPLLDDGSQ